MPLPEASETARYPIPEWRRSVDLTAEKLYQRINRMASPDRRLSRTNAEKLIDSYGPTAVLKALKRTEALYRKGRVGQPVGFLIVNARMASKVGVD